MKSKSKNILKHICVSDCVVACVRVLKVSLRTESGFKVNRACVGLKAAVEAGSPPTPHSALTHAHTHTHRVAELARALETTQKVGANLTQMKSGREPLLKDTSEEINPKKQTAEPYHSVTT